jgi:hypothetical protein
MAPGEEQSLRSYRRQPRRTTGTAVVVAVTLAIVIGLGAVPAALAETRKPCFPGRS